MNSIAIAMALETRRAGAGVLHEDERNRQGERGQEHQQKNANCTAPVVLVATCVLRRLGQLLQALVHVSSSPCCKDEATTDGRASAIRRRAFPGSVALRTARNASEAFAFFGQAAHQVENRVNDSPCEIASQCANQHRATSSRPTSATLSEPVKVRTMMTPKRVSETRLMGSSTRLVDLMDRQSWG